MLGEIIDITENTVIIKFNNGLNLAMNIKDLGQQVGLGDKVNINPYAQQNLDNKIINFF